MNRPRQVQECIDDSNTNIGMQLRLSRREFGAMASVCLSTVGVSVNAEASTLDGRGLSNSDILTGFAALQAQRMFFQNGNRFTLDQFRGRALLVNFWAYWCENCLGELADMLELQKAAGGPDQLAVVLVSSQQDWPNDQAMAKQRELPFMLAYYVTTDRLADSTMVASMLLGNVVDGAPKFGIPISYLISRSGRVVLGAGGGVPWLTQPMLAKTALALHS